MKESGKLVILGFMVLDNHPRDARFKLDTSLSNFKFAQHAFDPTSAEDH